MGLFACVMYSILFLGGFAGSLERLNWSKRAGYACSQLFMMMCAWIIIGKCSSVGFTHPAARIAFDAVIILAVVPVIWYEWVVTVIHRLDDKVKSS